MNLKQTQFYYKNNRLQQLRGFCYTAQFGNITRAARHMGLTQSSVSLQIKSLEQEMGVQLFLRNGPKISLTQDGERLLEIALPHIEGIQNIYNTFNQERDTVEKTEISIAVNSTAKNYLMPPLINRYITSYKDMYVSLRSAEHDEAISLIESEEIDCAVLPRRAHKPFPNGCVYTPIYYFKPSLITRADHPLAGRRNLSIEEISQYELTLPAENLRVISDLYRVFPQNNIQKKLRINFVNMETGREYIEAGLIITISSNVFIREGDMLVATPLPHLFDDVDYGFVTRKSRVLAPKIKNLVNLARDQAVELMGHS